jgi:hypothetical protein
VDRPRRSSERSPGSDRGSVAPGEWHGGGPSAPDLPRGAEFAALDPRVKRDLRGLTKARAELVGAHLVAAGMLLDADPEQAVRHAKFAKARAARVASVREAVALTAYHAHKWSESLGELRAVRRMTGSNAHAALMADCERALGRPERALEVERALRDVVLPDDVALELRIVVAGARQDMGQPRAALTTLQEGGLDPRRRDPGGVRLLYAYADALVAAGRERDAVGWFASAADGDSGELTDAAERAIALAEQLRDADGSNPIAHDPTGRGPRGEHRQ